MMNATAPPSKRSRMEAALNKMVYGLAFLVLFLCILSAILAAQFQGTYANKAWYLRDNTSPHIQGVQVFFT